jgi:hypothetical protein
MKLRTGQTLSSPVDTTTVVVIRAPGGDLEVTCAGVRLYDPRGDEVAPGGVPDPAQMDGTQLGKRYASDDVGLELLVTRAGKGTLAVNGTPLSLKGAKPLPASD